MTVTLCLREDREGMTRKSILCLRACTTYFIVPCFLVFFTDILMSFETHLANPSVAHWKRKTGKNLVEDRRRRAENVHKIPIPGKWTSSSWVSSLIFSPTPFFEKDFNEPFIGSLLGAYIVSAIFLLVSFLRKGKTKVHSVQMTFLKWEASESQK